MDLGYCSPQTFYSGHKTNHKKHTTCSIWRHDIYKPKEKISGGWITYSVSLHVQLLTHCGGETSYDAINLGQLWLTYWLVVSGGTKPLPEPALTYQKRSVEFTRVCSHKIEDTNHSCIIENNIFITSSKSPRAYELNHISNVNEHKQASITSFCL